MVLTTASENTVFKGNRAPVIVLPSCYCNPVRLSKLEQHKGVDAMGG